MPKSLCLLPLECCLGTRPNQAAMCLPFLNSAPSPTAATIAVAVFGPMPLILAMRWQTSSFLKIRSISRSNHFTRASRWPQRVEQLFEDRSEEIAELFTLSVEQVRYFASRACNGQPKGKAAIKQQSSHL